jgi:acyl-CoA thioester hydrolase
MNVAYYVLVFDHATDAVLDYLNVGEAYRQNSGCSVFVGEAHVTYEQEANAGDRLSVKSRILGFDGKRLILFHEMFGDNANDLVASNEVLCLHVDLKTRRTAAIPAAIADRIVRVAARHSELSRPSRAGRAIDLDARRPR